MKNTEKAPLAEELSERVNTVTNDDHEDFIYEKQFSVNEKSDIGFDEEMNLLNQKIDLMINEATSKYDSYLRNNPALSKKQKDDKHDQLFKPIYEFKTKEINAIKEKYTEEIKYNIHPKLSRKEELINSDVLLSVRHLKQYFSFGRKRRHSVKLKAVSNVSFDVKKGECFGIVGESGCGKTTTGRTIIKLYEPTSGSIYYRGYRIGAGSRWNEKEIKWKRIYSKKQIAELKAKAKLEIKNLNKDEEFANKKNEILSKLNNQIEEIKFNLHEIITTEKANIKRIKFDQTHTPKKLMNEIQMIFQDPIDSLDGRMTVKDIIEEGLLIQGHKDRKENYLKVVEMLEKVGLVEEHAARYPHEFSGGQRQRIGIARALVMNPKLLICDEPISALDVSIRAQVINLLNDLKEEMGLTLIFIAHDLSVVKYFCDRIAVMYFGKLVELADSDELFKHPLHPYTVSLLSAIPKPNPLTERNRTRIIYNPQTAHDYSVDKPMTREVCPGHTVYCNEKEFKEYQAKIKELDKKNK